MVEQGDEGVGVLEGQGDDEVGVVGLEKGKEDTSVWGGFLISELDRLAVEVDPASLLHRRRPRRRVRHTHSIVICVHCCR